MFYLHFLCFIVAWFEISFFILVFTGQKLPFCLFSVLHFSFFMDGIVDIRREVGMFIFFLQDLSFFSSFLFLL